MSDDAVFARASEANSWNSMLQHQALFYWNQLRVRSIFYAITIIYYYITHLCSSVRNVLMKDPLCDVCGLYLIRFD